MPPKGKGTYSEVGAFFAATTAPIDRGKPQKYDKNAIPVMASSILNPEIASNAVIMPFVNKVDGYWGNIVNSGFQPEVSIGPAIGKDDKVEVTPFANSSITSSKVGKIKTEQEKMQLGVGALEVVDAVRGKDIVGGMVDEYMESRKKVARAKMEINAVNFAFDAATFAPRVLGTIANNAAIIAGFGDVAQKAAVLRMALVNGVDSDVGAFIFDATTKSPITRTPATSGGKNLAAMGAQSITMAAGLIDKNSRSNAAAGLESHLRTIRMTTAYDANLNLPATDPRYHAAVDNARRTMKDALATATVAGKVKHMSAEWVKLDSFIDSAEFEKYAQVMAQTTVAGGISGKKGKAAELAKYSVAALSRAYTDEAREANAMGVAGRLTSGRGFENFDKKARALRLAEASMNATTGNMSMGQRYYYLRNRWESFQSDAPKAVTLVGLLNGDFLRFVSAQGGWYQGQNQGAFAGFMGGLYKDKHIKSGLMSQYFSDGSDMTFNIGIKRYKDAAGNPGKWSLAVGFHANNENREFEGQKFTVKKLSWYGGGYFVDPNANKARKWAFIAYTFHPWQMAMGALNGSLWQRMVWIGSKYGTIRDPKQFSIVGKIGLFAFKRLSWVYGAQRLLQFGMRTPQMLINKAVMSPLILLNVAWNRVKLLLSKFMNTFIGKFMGGIMKIALGPVGAILAVGQLGYKLLNFVTGGLLDSVFGRFLKAFFDFYILFIVGAVILMGYTCSNSANSVATQFAPNAAYSPVPVAVGEDLSYSRPVSNALSVVASVCGTGVGSASCLAKKPVDDYCPFRVDSGNAFTCAQGPFGAESHACSLASTRQMAMDNKPSYPAVYAPTDGTVTKVGDINCLADGLSTGNFMQFTTTGDGKNATDTRQFIDQMIFTFNHVTPLVAEGTVVKRGDIIGVMTPVSDKLSKVCVQGSHVHTAVINARTRIEENAQTVMTQLCGGQIRCSQGDSNSPHCAATPRKF